AHARALGGEENHLGPPPRHDRPRRAPDDAQQAVTLLARDLSNAYSFAHLTSLFVGSQFCATRRSKWWTRPSNVGCRGTRDGGDLMSTKVSQAFAAMVL